MLIRSLKKQGQNILTTNTDALFRSSKDPELWLHEPAAFREESAEVGLHGELLPLAQHHHTLPALVLLAAVRQAHLQNIVFVNDVQSWQASLSN